MAEQSELIIKSSAATTATENSGTLIVPDGKGYRGVVIFVDVTAVSGTPTLDITVDRWDPAASKWLAITGAALAQITTAAGQVDLIIYPGIGETANRAVSDHIGSVWRVVSTIGGSTPSLTYSIGATYLV